MSALAAFADESAIYDDAYFAVMQGDDCEFWPRNQWRTAVDYPEYDADQCIALFNAVRVAASLISATDEDRWTVVESALRAEADRFAEWKREQV